MADVKISGLPSYSPPISTDVVPIDDVTNTVTKKITLATLAAFFFSGQNIPAGSGSPLTRDNEAMFSYIASGLVWSADAAGSTLLASMTAGVIYINGRRISIGAVTGRAFTASKDTYIDVLDNLDGTGTLVYTTATNNAASVALAANSTRIGIIITGATNIAAATSINQGQETMVLPIASSIPYAVTDSIGNLIYPTDPSRRTLGYRQIIGVSTNSTQADVVGLTAPVIVPAGRKVKIIFDCQSMSCTIATGSGTYTLYIMEGATQLALVTITSVGNGFTNDMHREVEFTPSAGAHTYKIQTGSSSGTVAVNAASNSPTFVRIELA